jgi:hypothetical protein
MAIIEKPSGSSEVFATPEEALKCGKPVMSIRIADFLDTLQRSEIQAMHKDVRALADAGSDPVSPEQS